MNISVLTPQTTLFQGEGSRVNVPGTSGQFEILKGHAAIVSSLVAGTVKITTAEGIKTFDITKGFIEVLNDEISILVQK